jgi:hypothetical protein
MSKRSAKPAVVTQKPVKVFSEAESSEDDRPLKPTPTKQVVETSSQATPTTRSSAAKLLKGPQTTQQERLPPVKEDSILIDPNLTSEEESEPENPRKRRAKKKTKGQRYWDREKKKGETETEKMSEDAKEEARDRIKHIATNHFHKFTDLAIAFKNAGDNEFAEYLWNQIGYHHVAALKKLKWNNKPVVWRPMEELIEKGNKAIPVPKQRKDELKEVRKKLAVEDSIPKNVTEHLLNSHMQIKFAWLSPMIGDMSEMAPDHALRVADLLGAEDDYKQKCMLLKGIDSKWKGSGTQFNKLDQRIELIQMENAKRAVANLERRKREAKGNLMIPFLSGSDLYAVFACFAFSPSFAISPLCAICVLFNACLRFRPVCDFALCAICVLFVRYFNA